MAYLKLASLVVLFATFGMFLAKNAEAKCNGICSPFENPPCGSTECRCIPAGIG
ncbi:hypothetical protein RYX36_008680, partial [Vicia faba]